MDASGLEASADDTDGEDREILFALLAPCLGWAEAAEATEAIMARYGGFPAAAEAAEADLAALPALGEAGAAAIKAVHAAALRLARRGNASPVRPVLDSTRAVVAHLGASAAPRPAGEVRALFLDAGEALIAEEPVGGADATGEAGLPARVVRRALAREASSVVLVRRLGGDPVALPAEAALAGRVQEAALLVGLRLTDHLLLGRAGHVSLRGQGLLGAG
jgi:DNA repair protein RadC